MFPPGCRPCGRAYTPPVRRSCRTAANNVPIPYADLLLQLVCEFCRNSCVEKSARKKHVYAPENRRAKPGFLPASLLVPVAEAAHVVHIVPPVCPMDQPVYGNPFHLHGQAKPAHAKGPLCGPLVRRHSGGRLRAGKPAGKAWLSPAPLLIPVVPVTRKTVTQSHISWPE